MVKKAKVSEGNEVLLGEGSSLENRCGLVQVEITARCKVCEKTGPFRYLGTQYKGQERLYDLYNCKCGATKSFNPSESWRRRRYVRR